MPRTTLQPITERPDVAAVHRMRIELGTTVPELVAERLEDARTELIEAMKLCDCAEYRDLYVSVGELTNRLDGTRMAMAERNAS